MPHVQFKQKLVMITGDPHCNTAFARELPLKQNEDTVRNYKKIESYISFDSMFRSPVLR